jgi:hypothetical protein
MANLFKVRLNKTTNDFEQLFELAFQDIYALAEKICTSKNKIVKDFLHNYHDEPWMELDNDSIILTIVGPLVIGRNDVQGRTQIEYDFYKRSPVDDAFLLAIMSIFYHHLPETEFYSEVKAYNDSFDDGVILARLVNDKIKNPFFDNLIPLEELVAEKEIKEVYLALTNIVPRKKDRLRKREVRFY